MSKFKIGDEVIATSSDGTSWQGVIRYCTSDGYWVVDFPKKYTWGVYREKSLDTVYPVSPKRKYYNIIFVTHDEDKYPVKRKYIFGIERGVKVEVGDKLWADTRYGKKVVTAYCEPFDIDEHGLDQLSKIHGGYGKLKDITGRAVQRYTEEPLCDVPF